MKQNVNVPVIKVYIIENSDIKSFQMYEMNRLSMNKWLRHAPYIIQAHGIENFPIPNSLPHFPAHHSLHTYSGK